MSDAAREVRIIFDNYSYERELESFWVKTKLSHLVYLRWMRFDTTYGPWIGAVVILGSLALAWAGAAWGTR